MALQPGFLLVRYDDLGWLPRTVTEIRPDHSVVCVKQCAQNVSRDSRDIAFFVWS